MPRRSPTPGHVIDDAVVEALAGGPLTVAELREHVTLGGSGTIKRSLHRLASHGYARSIGSRKARGSHGGGRPSQVWVLK
jgi:predicted transcriptional regulator